MLQYNRLWSNLYFERREINMMPEKDTIVEKTESRSIDPEHDPRLHLKNEAHDAPGDYDPKYGVYRTNGG